MTEHDELSRMLHDKVQTFDVRPSDVPQVTARAHRIRARRRMVAVSAVAAAVVVAAVPTALALRPDNSSSGPLQPTPTGPTTPTTGSSAPAPSTLAQIPQGSGPRVAWRQGRTVHLEGGRTLTLPHGTWSGFAPYRGGIVVGSTNDISDEIAVVDADGRVVLRGGGSGPVLSPDRSRVTWWSQQLAAFVSGPTSDTGGGADTTLPTVARRPRPIGYLGGQLVYRVDSDTGGVAVSCGTACTVTISGMSTVRAVDSERRLLAGYVDAGSPQVAPSCPTAVFHIPDLTGSTSRTVHVSSSWRCTSDTPETFSPDGSALALTHQGADGTVTGLRVRDSASGSLRASYDAPSGVQVGAMVWEDDSHLLVDVFDAPYGEWTVLRVGLDRTVERAAAVVPGDDTLNPFGFGVQP
jgi:hypothetical protein